MVTFRGAIVNINALSDTHGMLANCPAGYQIFEDNKEEVFVDPGLGRRNLLMVAGDWFMAGNTKPYLTRPEAYAQEVQCGFFNEFVKNLKSLSKDLKVFFTIGNHEINGGAALLDNSIQGLDALTVVTNLKLGNSPGLGESIRAKKLVNRYLLEVEDDKIEGKIHNVLILGLSPVNMAHYNKALANILNFTDNINKHQKDLQKEDFQKTIDEFNKEIDAFKEKHKNGVVVIMTHSGGEVADALIESNPDINLILCGHEHRDRLVNISRNKKIVNLSENFNKIENVKIIIDDNGKVRIKARKYEANMQKAHENAMDEYALKTLFKDFERRYEIKSDCEEIKYLSKDNVRRGNNHLANYVTDVILSEVQRIDSGVQIFGITSSAFRSGLPTSESEVRRANYSELISVLSGVKDVVGDIYVDEMTGRELIQVILENLRFNAENPRVNPLMHYSGLTINKKILRKSESRPIDELAKYVHIGKTGKEINLGHIYKIASTQKRFFGGEFSEVKTDEPRNNPKKLKDVGKHEDANAKKLFRRYFKRLEAGKIKKPIKVENKARLIDTVA